MAMQIVTGYTGTEHIKSMHDRARNAGTFGTASYVLSTGNMLGASMQSANTVRILDGDLCLQGTHATIEPGTHEDLTVENGTQGQVRNDLVVARYEKLAADPKTESVTLKVIKGTPAEGTAADPDYAEGDVLAGDLVAEFPLYRIPIDGITPGDPVPLFDVVVPMAELKADLDALRDSVSQRPLDLTPNSALANYSTYTNSSTFDGRSATLQCSVVLSKATDWNSDELILFTLPEGARPSEDCNLYRCCMCFAASGRVYLRGARVGADGRVRFLNQASGTEGVQCCAIVGVSYRI